MSKEIDLGKGKFAIVDDSDYEWLSKWEWTSSGGWPGIRYAIRRENGKKIFMHREILSAPDGMQVDHINRNGIDNRRCNIRLCNNSQNQANKTRSRSNKSGYKGVIKDGRKWRASLTKDGKKIHIGAYSTAEEAARAYDEAARKYHGEFARTNF